MPHVDVTKYGNIPDGGGWRFVGRQQGERNRRATARRTGSRNSVYEPQIGTAFVHTVVDDHSRVACAELGIRPQETRPYRPQTNGKVERFHRTLTDGWAIARLYTCEQARSKARPAFLHRYNHHRPTPPPVAYRPSPG